ncbi:hypothetical protein HY285_02685, partial [Candidatus Peregrinibacteria bacterium]|nr:hypothetical protein [Candidatus Peregrinibacteria bacterium]MBI3816427.1 hypothetical protein [Candidatus Peregrinibacteria bacterium]
MPRSPSTRLSIEELEPRHLLSSTASNAFLLEQASLIHDEALTSLLQHGDFPSALQRIDQDVSLDHARESQIQETLASPPTPLLQEERSFDGSSGMEINPSILTPTLRKGFTIDLQIKPDRISNITLAAQYDS